jgi:ABC-type transporter Mla subunit MlaD
MSPESLRVRLEKLERRVDILEQLPDRVSALEVQIVHLRDEMRSEFSETRSRDGDTRRVLNERMDSLAVTLNERMDSLAETLSKQMVSLSETLSERMVSLFDANERHMRLLHEDLIQRIAIMKESRP